MKKHLFIYGAGGLGKEVLALVNRLEGWEVKGFLDDGISAGTLVKGIPVVGGLDAVRQMSDASIVLALGDSVVKQNLSGRINPDLFCDALVDPRAVLLDHSSIQVGKGSILAAGCVITSNIHIGDHVLINLNVTIGHDTHIGHWSSIMPGANIAGEVTLGNAVLVGSGANIRNRVTVGEGAVVGMGAVVLKNVQEGDTVAGVPARSLTVRKSGRDY